jgi:hypothetical protein
MKRKQQRKRAARPGKANGKGPGRRTGLERGEFIKLHKTGPGAPGPHKPRLGREARARSGPARQAQEHVQGLRGRQRMPVHGPAGILGGTT